MSLLAHKLNENGRKRLKNESKCCDKLVYLQEYQLRLTILKNNLKKVLFSKIIKPLELTHSKCLNCSFQWAYIKIELNFCELLSVLYCSFLMERSYKVVFPFMHLLPRPILGWRMEWPTPTRTSPGRNKSWVNNSYLITNIIYLCAKGNIICMAKVYCDRLKISMILTLKCYILHR